MSKLTPTWICQIPYQNLTKEKFQELPDLEQSYYLRGYNIPESKSPERVYVAYVDGGCYRNGQEDSEAYGSYKIYDVTELVYKGIVPSHIHQMTQDPRFVPVEENERFSLALGGSTRATNNYAEAASMQMLIMTGVHKKYISPNTHLFIFSDSELIINHLKGIYSVKNQQLATIYKGIHKFLNEYQIKNKQTAWGDFNLGKIPGTLMKKILGH